MFTGCGTAWSRRSGRRLVSTKQRCARWSAARSSRASISWSPAAPPAKAPRSPARTSARGRDHGRRSQGQSPRPRRRRRLQHPRSDRTRPRSRSARRRRHPLRHALLQQAHAGRPYQHYKAIAAAVPLPIIVYSVQGRTGVNVEPATLERLAEIENIVGVKEASGNITQMANVIHEVPERFRRCSPATTPSPSRSSRSAATASSPWSRTRFPPR